MIYTKNGFEIKQILKKDKDWGINMAFNTLTFLLFFVVILILYYIVPLKYRWIFLLLSSYFFYLYASVKFALFIIITTISSYIGAIMIDKTHVEERKIKDMDLTAAEKKIEKEKIKKNRKFILISLLVLNFGILVFLKYFNFFAQNLNVLFDSISLANRVPTFNLILPLGISFYTFQTMSYVIDVYWGKVNAERNLGKVALFVSFFPQIIEGPIGRFKDLAPQLYKPNANSEKNIVYGVQLMMWGYFKKMVIADRVAVVADFVFGNYLSISGVGTIIGIFLYAIQDYTDFSGCIDIARGCAQAMGIEMAENFKRPYFSRTIPEFWRRWHMSLGAWMKDYVFYPFSLTKVMRKLGKATKKRFGKYLGRTLPVAIGNILVFFLVGVWHGANWNYIVWGLFYGVLIAIASLMKPIFDWLNTKLKIKTNSKLFIGFQILRTFWITCIGCIIFRAENLHAAWDIFLKSFQIIDFPLNIKAELLTFGLNKANYIVLLVSLIILFIIDVFQEKMLIRDWFNKRNLVFKFFIYFIAFAAIIALGMYGPGMSSNQFVYMQF